MVQGCISEIRAKITQLQVELNQLQPELSTITADLKADFKRKLQLYNQAKALDREIYSSEETELILQHKVESGV